MDEKELQSVKEYATIFNKIDAITAFKLINEIETLKEKLKSKG
jgi:hypothetical protein